MCLRHGTVGLGDFTPQAIGDPDTLVLARRLSVIADANPDPNALHPARVELDLSNSRTLACDVADVLGSPARPLSAAAARVKFAACCHPLPDHGATLSQATMALESAADSADLARSQIVPR